MKAGNRLSDFGGESFEMATLDQLQEQKRDLEERLYSGDESAESQLERVEAAIRVRTQKIQHSQKRLAAVKDAVAKGLTVDQAKSAKPESKAKKSARLVANKPVNRFE